MEIKNLQNTPLNKIVACLSESFANYYVPLPTELDYWQQRFEGARVNFELSFGCFDNDELVGFVIHGIDRINGQLVAYNTGTGVTGKFRGQQITSQIYTYALPYLKQYGVALCTLEVIEQNHLARKVYEHIGFSQGPKLLSFQGMLKEMHGPTTTRLKEVSLADIEPEIRQNDAHYSWDNNYSGIKKLEQFYKCYEVDGSDFQGYMVVHPARNILVQAETSSGTVESYRSLLYSLRGIMPAFKIINVHENRHNLVEALKEAGLESLINQYEMHMSLV